MFRTVAISSLTACAYLLAACTAVPAGAQEDDEHASEVAPVTSNGEDSGRAERARERAVQALASRLGITAGDIAVLRTEPQTWPDSSMGCGKPGSLAMQVITEGHAVMLSAQGKEYRVHVSNTHAVVCDKPVFTRKELKRPARARGLNEAVQASREDLARRLGADVAKIALVRAEPHEWPNNGLGCPLENEAIVDAPVRGYRILLQYASRTYTYHSDLKDVRPCPAIEAM